MLKGDFVEPNQPAPKKFNKNVILILAVVIALFATVGVAAYFLAFKPEETPKTTDNTSQTETEKTETESVKQTETEKPTEQVEQPKTEVSNKGYLVVKQWGLRFKIPQGMADIQYRIQGDKVYFYGKPSSPKVEYRSDYDADKQGKYVLGYLKRSKEANISNDWGSVSGKQVGDYYYYTGHSFSGLESGIGLNGLFYTTDCIDKAKAGTDYDDKACQDLMEAESKTFSLINGGEGSVGLLPAIELLP